MSDFGALPLLDLRKVQPKVDYVISTFERQLAPGGIEHSRLRKIDRFLPYALTATLQTGKQSWEVIRMACRQDQPLELTMAVPPLVRNMAEIIYWTMYLFDDPVAQARRMLRCTWAKIYKSNNLLRQRYAANKEWRDHLRELDAQRDWWGEQAGATREDLCKVDKIARSWPTPGRKLRDELQDQRRREFLGLVDDLFYGRLSQEVHLTGGGLLQQVGRSFFGADYAAKDRSDLVSMGFLLYLVFLSELALDVTRVGHPLRLLQEVWLRSGEVFGFIQEVWEARYEELFSERRHGL